MSQGDRQLFQFVERRSQEQHILQAYATAGNELSEAVPSFISIDEALHYVSGNPYAVELGKCAIISNILKAEAASKLAFRNGVISLPSDGWLFEFFGMAISGLSKSEIGSAFNNVSIINFNYDRCIEHYIYHALVERAGIDESRAQEIVARINIVRPYGTVGGLRWMKDGIEFGANRFGDPFSMVGRIRTYTEGIRDESGDIAKTLESAKIIVSLGFGFHQQNLDLLQRNHKSSQLSMVLATSYAIDSANYPAIVKRLASNIRFSPNFVELVPTTAGQLLLNQRARILLSLE